jgi:hypothetical protein
MVATHETDKDNVDDLLMKADRMIREDMTSHYGMGFEVFHEWGHVEFGEDDKETYIRFYIVFDGKFEVLKENLRKGETGRIRKLLANCGIGDFPMLTFVSKREWARSGNKLRANA